MDPYCDYMYEFKTPITIPKQLKLDMIGELKILSKELHLTFLLQLIDKNWYYGN